MTVINEQTRNDCQIKAFFDSWHVYDVVIRHNYMAHREIHHALSQVLHDSTPKGFRLLDLGCGDAFKISQTLRGLPIDEYLGIDLSPVALEAARKNFGSADFKVSFIESELGDFLLHSHEPMFDVVLAGFVLHHYTEDEKSSFFRRCAQMLKPSGEILLYDTFFRPGENRQTYMDSYCENIRTNWTALSPAEQDSICSHVLNCDFPVTYINLAKYAGDVGFTALSEPIYIDATGFHCLCRFALGS